MAETLVTVGIILIIIWFFARRSMDYKPGSKTWAINTDIVIDELKNQYEPVENLKNASRDHEHRMSRIEIDLERMSTIIDMYKEFVSNHQTEEGFNLKNKPSKRKKEKKVLNG